MKKLFSVMLLLPMFMYAQEGIRFEEGLTWNQVLQKAKAENKYIFVDCYASWCGPCKWMDENIYPTQAVADIFNHQFISVKAQMDTSKSDNDLIKNRYADAEMLKNRYEVKAYPTYLFFSPEGVAVHKETGAKDTAGFITVGKDALNTNKQYYVLLEKYLQSKLDTAFMKYLARKAKEVEGDELARKIASDYINRVPLNALFAKDNIQFMYEFTASSKDRGFVVFRDSAKRIQETDERITEEICRNIIVDIIHKEEIKPYGTTNKGKPDWKKIKSNLEKYGLLGREAFVKYQPGMIYKAEIEPALKVNSEWNHILALIKKQKLGKNAEFLVGSTIIFYLNAVMSQTEDNCKNVVAAATYYADSFPTFVTSRGLNDWGWVLFENSNDENELRWALQCSKLSTELEPSSPEILDTYANLLYKLGHTDEAIEWEGKAIVAADAKNYGMATTVFRETLEKMKKAEKTWPQK